MHSHSPAPDGNVQWAQWTPWGPPRLIRRRRRRTPRWHWVFESSSPATETETEADEMDEAPDCSGGSDDTDPPDAARH